MEVCIELGEVLSEIAQKQVSILLEGFRGSP